MKQLQPKDTLTRLWARLGIDQAPLVRAPRRATDNGRGICTFMNMNMAYWLENVQGYDPSQFDEEYYSQVTLKQFICQNAGYPYTLYEVFGPQVSFNPAGGTWNGTYWTYTNIQDYAFAVASMMNGAMQLQYPYPVPDTSGNLFLDFNNTGYIDEMDAAAWTTCIGYYGCS